LQLPTFHFYSIQSGLFAGGVFLVDEMLIEAEDESTRACGEGQFPKFGAVRKKAGTDLGACAAGKKILQAFDSCMRSAGLLAVSKREAEFGEVEQDYFHSGCTGNTEMHLENQPRIFTGSHGSIKFLGEGRVSDPAPQAYRPANAGSWLV
jgi:hypothetical protein